MLLGLIGICLVSFHDPGGELDQIDRAVFIPGGSGREVRRQRRLINDASVRAHDGNTFPVDRGGEITYHGPGQLVGYPILALADGVGVVDYVRALEGAVISLLAGYGIVSGRVEGRTGVWLEASGSRRDRKICAIGVRVARRTTMHGFALNVQSSAERFGNIVPCGIHDADVTSIVEELPGAWDVAAVAHDLEPHLVAALAPIRARGDR